MTEYESIELNTTIPNLHALETSDLSAYDAVYLGASFCLLYADNFITHADDLSAAVSQLKEDGKSVYLSTYAIPLTADLDRVRENVARGVEAGIDGAEIHNMGVARLLAREFPGLRLVAGSFSNVYTDMTAAVLKEYGVRRIVPNHELPLEETDLLREDTDLEIELLVHGKIPLGVSESCFLLSFQGETGLKCPDLCQHNFRLRRDSWEMVSLGKAVVSGKDMCMVEHLPMLLDSGYRVFRLEGLSESPAYRATVAAVYREAFRDALADPEGFRTRTRAYKEQLDRVSTGFCNGYFFGLPGRFYRDAEGTVHEES